MACTCGTELTHHFLYKLVERSESTGVRSELERHFMHNRTDTFVIALSYASHHFMPFVHILTLNNQFDDDLFFFHHRLLKFQLFNAVGLKECQLGFGLQNQLHPQ